MVADGFVIEYEFYDCFLAINKLPFYDDVYRLSGARNMVLSVD